MLSLIASPIVSKILAVLTTILIIACTALAVMYYREKSISAGAEVRINSALSLAEQAQEANRENSKTVALLQQENDKNRQLAAQAINRQQEAEQRAEAFQSKLEDAVRDPKTRAWADTPLPANVIRLFNTGNSDSNKNRSANGVSPSGAVVQQNEVAATAH